MNQQFSHSGARYNDRSAAAAASSVEAQANLQFQQQSAFIREMFGSKDERGVQQEKMNEAIVKTLDRIASRLDVLESNSTE